MRSGDATLAERGHRPIREHGRAHGGPPTQEMVARMEAVQERLARVNVIDIACLGTAVVTMAIARYL